MVCLQVEKRHTKLVASVRCISSSLSSSRLRVTPHALFRQSGSPAKMLRHCCRSIPHHQTQTVHAWRLQQLTLPPTPPVSAAIEAER